MVDNIKFNKILPSLSAAPKVKRMDRRSGNDRQNPFQELLKKKRRKKKLQEDSQLATIPDEENFAGGEPGDLGAVGQDADKGEKTAECPSNRIIDIRV
jgi:hypothetical protein